MNPYILNALIYGGIAIAVFCLGVGLFVISETISLRREAKRDREKFRRRFATGCRPLMVLMLLCGAVAQGQEPVKGDLIPSVNNKHVLCDAEHPCTTRTISNIYHEKFEYVDGKLRILKPVDIEYAVGSLDVGSSEFRIVNRLIPPYYDKREEWKESERLVLTSKPAPQAEAEPAKTICGTNIVGPNAISRHTELIQVTCPPWGALGAIGAMPVPTGQGPQTQVLIHVREGRTFVAELDGWEKAEVLRDLNFAPGLKGGMIVFDGNQFKTLKISVQGDLP